MVHYTLRDGGDTNIHQNQSVFPNYPNFWEVSEVGSESFNISVLEINLDGRVLTLSINDIIHVTWNGEIFKIDSEYTVGVIRQIGDEHLVVVGLESDTPLSFYLHDVVKVDCYD